MGDVENYFSYRHNDLIMLAAWSKNKEYTWYHTLVEWRIVMKLYGKQLNDLSDGANDNSLLEWNKQG